MKKCLALLGLAVVLMIRLESARAQHFVSVSAGVERVENPSLSSTSPGGATLLRVAPSYAFEEEHDRIRSRLSLGAVLERSSNPELLASRDYPSLGYTWTYSWPTSSLELRANLAEVATRDTELEDLGRITVDSRERTVGVGASWSQELTERTRLALGLTNARVSYSSALLDSYSELGVSSRISWEATERLVYYLEPSYSRLNPTGAAPEATLNRLQAGARVDLSPGWSISSSIGKARIGGVFPASVNVAGLQLAYGGRRLTSGVDWSSDVLPSAATTSYIRAGSLALRVGYRFSETATVSAGLTRSRSGGEASSRGQVSSLTLENEVGFNWLSTFGVEDRRASAVGGTSANGWALRVGLTYAFPGR